MNKYTILSLNLGFYKIKRPDGIIHNMSEHQVNELKKDKNNSFSKIEEVKETKEVEVKDSNEKPLNKMNKSDLSEIAVRSGFEGDVNDLSITKAVLIKFIEAEQDQD